MYMGSVWLNNKSWPRQGRGAPIDYPIALWLCRSGKLNAWLVLPLCVRGMVVFIIRVPELSNTHSDQAIDLIL
jgi:hypothetical protein